jgi:hypothetical protein
MTSGAFLLVLSLVQFGQSNTGELRLTVTDAAGLPAPSTVELVSEAIHLRQLFSTDGQGVLVARRLPFGAYRLAVTRDGFAPFVGLVEIRSALPTDYRVSLSISPLQTDVTVKADQTLLDPRQATTVNRIGAETLQQRTSALPGRSLPDLVNSQPGWLLEANGILHPRASEYQTQYIVDGLPFTDNRSPAFAPEIGTDDVRAMTILTGGYPAEYGRKLGGVIEVVTVAQARRGARGSLAASVGSFGTLSGNAVAEYGWRRMTLGVSGGAAGTDRFLDPPVEENDSNRGMTSQAAIHFERDVSDADRVGVILRHGDARFLVPNERVQEEVGQRQDRDSRETMAQFSYQHIFSGRVLGDLRGMARDLSARLRSNAESIPAGVQQQRGFREIYLKGTIAAHIGAHELKAGGDVDAGTIRERFGYRLTDADRFDPGTPVAFDFDDRRSNREQSLFVQDQIRFGAWTVNGGLRWDHYDLLVDESALSPRLAAAWSWPRANLVARASYDRVFQTPAFENLLLASSDTADALNSDVVRLPVPPSRGNFYEGGFTSGLFGRLRLDASVFVRRMSDAADDDLLLNTGVSFPIAFHSAHVAGAEIKLEVPRWKGLSGYVSYGRMRATTELPVTGGLFLGEEGTELLQSNERLAATQDQRHTVRGRASYQVAPSVWVAFTTAYGSGLPFEDFDGDRAEAAEQFGERILERVNFETGRVRPSLSFDGSMGLTLAQTESRSLRVQMEVRNLTNRLNLINFAGLFSGTALAPPRSVAVRVSVDF